MKTTILFLLIALNCQSQFLGSYDLALRSDIARCLYGFTSAPISATIEVVSQFGEKQVAVTTVNEKNGWLYLSAKGFTFSSPTVSVKLTQEVQATVVVKKTSNNCNICDFSSSIWIRRKHCK